MKILAAVKQCNDEGFDPSVTAVAYLLRGEEAVVGFDYFKTFGTLSSFSTKKLKASVTSLLKRGYLAGYRLPGYEEIYVLITEDKEAVAQAFLAKFQRKKPLISAAPLFNERN